MEKLRDIAMIKIAMATAGKELEEYASWLIADSRKPQFGGD